MNTGDWSKIELISRRLCKDIDRAGGDTSARVAALAITLAAVLASARAEMSDYESVMDNFNGMVRNSLEAAYADEAPSQ